MKPRIVLLLTFLLFIRVSCFPEQLTGWEYPLKINDTQLASNPEFINNQKVVGIIYIDSTYHTNGLFCSITTDQGQTWSKPRYILESTSGRLYPISAISKNNIIYVTFNDDDDKLYFTKSTNLGRSWMKPFQLPTTSVFSFLPKIILDEAGGIHVFYHQENLGKFTLYQLTSADGGITWTGPKTILKDIGINEPSKERGNFFPSITIYQDCFYITLQSRTGGGGEKINDNLIFVSSPDNGKTWTNPARLSFDKSDDVRPFLIQHPPETLGTNAKTELHLFWERNVSNAWNIFHRKGTVLKNNEVDWDDPEQFTFSQNGAHYPQAFMYQGALYLFWYQFYDGVNQIFYKTFDFTEQKWSPEHKFTEDKTDNKREVCTTLMSNIFVCWQSEDKKKGVSSIILRSLDRSVAKPELTSETHSDGIFSTNRHVRISCKPIRDPSGIKGFASILDSFPGTAPDILNSEFSNFSTEFNLDNDGIFYFHLRAIDKADNWSEPATFKVCVDSVPPEILSISSPDFNEGLPTSSVSGTFNIDARAISGISGYSYSIGLGQMSQPPKRILSKTNVIQVTVPGKGDVNFSVAALNNAGKWGSPKTFKFRYQGDVTPPSTPFISSLTHPEGLTSTNRNAEFTWQSYDASGIRGYSYIITTESNMPVPEKVTTISTQWTFQGVKNGLWYLKVKAEDNADNWSLPSTYSFRIFTDDEGPVITSLALLTDPSTLTNSTNRIVPELAFSWSATDVSGVREFRYFLSDHQARDHDFDWTPINTNAVVFTNLARRDYFFYLSAVDNKGNQSSVTMTSIPLTRPEVRETQERRLNWVVKIKPGDTLAKLVTRVLKVRDAYTVFGLVKSVAWYNYIGDLDLIYPDDKLRFPVVTTPTDDPDPKRTAERLLGCTNRRDDLIIPDTSQKDKIILRDGYFLKYGRMRPITGKGK